LITILPNRGAVVPAPSPDDIEELFAIRGLLEPEVLKRSIPHLTEEDLSQAEEILSRYVSELRQDDHVSAWGRLNWEFHSTLYSRANQARFMAIIRNVNNSGERYTRLQLYLTHGVKRANEDTGQTVAWVAQSDSGESQYLAIFNIGESTAALRYEWKDLGLTGRVYKLRNLWEHKDLDAASSMTVTFDDGDIGTPRQRTVSCVPCPRPGSLRRGTTVGCGCGPDTALTDRDNRRNYREPR
jgi:hypothetical protein